MFAWFRRVFASIFGWFDLVARVEQLEDDFRDIELDWIDQVDKLTKLHRRAVKRVADGTAALAEEAPTITDVRANRRQRLIELRNRRADGRVEAVR